MTASTALLFLALFALAAGMPRHGPVLLGQRFTPAIGRRAPVAGWCLLALSLALIFAAPRWWLALIEWLGLVALMGGGLVLSLTYGAWAARVAAFGAIGFLVASWLA